MIYKIDICETMELLNRMLDRALEKLKTLKNQGICLLVGEIQIPWAQYNT